MDPSPIVEGVGYAVVVHSDPYRLGIRAVVAQRIRAMDLLGKRPDLHGKLGMNTRETGGARHP